jgi:hypothetical protein
VLYFDYYQHQQRSGIVRSEILIKVFKTFQPGIENLIGIKDKNAVQLLFSTADGLLAASIYDCEIDWAAQGKMIGKIMELYAEEET